MTKNLLHWNLERGFNSFFLSQLRQLVIWIKPEQVDLILKSAIVSAHFSCEKKTLRFDSFHSVLFVKFHVYKKEIQKFYLNNIFCVRERSEWDRPTFD